MKEEIFEMGIPTRELEKELEKVKKKKIDW
jgi:hypothetical protein